MARKNCLIHAGKWHIPIVRQIYCTLYPVSVGFVVKNKIIPLSV